MIHRFPSFEIDEDTRELRAAGRTLPLQPRVFDLLVYLARHSARVVPKDELLDNVWPGVLVTDGSLQRAVSLARATLAEAGVPDAIHTHARQGYRLHVDAAPPAAAPARSPALARAHEAYARGDWDATIAALRAVDDVEGLSAADLQLWAHAAQCAGRPHDAAAPLERAVAAYSARGDKRRAAWVAILLGQLRVEWREPAVARGWYHRAARLLEQEPPCRERGYHALLGARMALLQADLEGALRLGEEARLAGEQFSDPDLEGLGLVHVGEARLYLGQIREGMAALDEAGVSVVASGLSPWAGGLVYCGVIYSCMTRADWQRAGQWTEQFTRWSAERGAAAYPGLCRMHRAEVLTVRGDRREAEKEIRSTIDMLALRAPWAEGEAWRGLGDVLLARGTLDKAREAYARATELGADSQFGLAMVRFAQGDAAGATDLLDRAIADDAWSTRSMRGQALAQLAICASLADRPETAARALATLDREPDLVSSQALEALVARARGELAAARDDRKTALVHMRAALRTWRSLEAPLPAAQARCRISHLLAAEGDVESAALELDAAVSAFQEAGAHGLLRQCERLRSALERRAAPRRRRQPVSKD